MRICGFILAAGLGTRLRPVFPDIPKPLVPLGGRPAIAWAMDFLKVSGATRVIVNMHYLKDQMKKALPGVLPPGMELHISEEETLLGTGGGVLHVRDWFASYDWLIVINADILTDFLPGKLLSRAMADGTDVHLILSAEGPKEERDKIGLFHSGDLWLPGEATGKIHRRGIFTGIHFIRPPALLDYPEIGPVSIIEVYRNLMRTGKKVRGSFTKKFWVDLGTEDGYRRGLLYLSEKRKDGSRQEV